MPIFGKSLFETVLEGLDHEVEEEEQDASSPVRGFNGGFVGRDWGANGEAERDPSSLFEGFPPDPVVLMPVIPDWIDRLSEAEIAEDLQLKHCRTAHGLREKRRSFAFENHPDRVPVDYRDQATRRMMIANQLIDSALARLL